MRLAMVAHTQSDFPLCRRYLHEACQIALHEAWLWEYSAIFLVDVARLWIAEGKKEHAIELITFALPNWDVKKHQFWKFPSWTHFGVPPEDLLAELEAELPPDIFAAAKQRGQASHLNTVVAAVADDLAASVAQDDPRQTSSDVRVHLADQPLIEPLTERELEVLALIIEGYRNREIADRLYVGVSTVKKHVNHIFGKLGVDSRARAIARARELDLL